MPLPPCFRYKTSNSGHRAADCRRCYPLPPHRTRLRCEAQKNRQRYSLRRNSSPPDSPTTKFTDSSASTPTTACTLRFSWRSWDCVRHNHRWGHKSYSLGAHYRSTTRGTTQQHWRDVCVSLVTSCRVSDRSSRWGWLAARFIWPTIRQSTTKVHARRSPPGWGRGHAFSTAVCSAPERSDRHWYLTLSFLPINTFQNAKLDKCSRQTKQT